MKKTLFLYILKEISSIFFIGVMVFTIILLMEKIIRLIELIILKGVNLYQILMLLFFISPSFLILTIPIAVLLGILLGFGRLSSDSEITAFKASGISLYQLFFPVSIFSIGACLLTLFLVFYGLPWGNRGFIANLYLIAYSKSEIEIKERVFNDLFDGFVVYVEKIPIQGKKMEGIMIYDERDKEKTNTIFAQEGFLINSGESQDATLRLNDGEIHRFELKTNVYQKVQFNTYDIKLEVGKALLTMGRKFQEREMSVEGIKERIEKMKKIGENTTSLEVELHKRYAIPFTCIVFGLIGVPLGIQPRRSGRSYGFVYSIFIVLIYYISHTAFEMFAVRRIIPPFFAGWAPNFIFGGFGVYLLVKAANESPFKPLIGLTQTLDLVQEKWKGLFNRA
jgi:lipopolysaccharide export system permease protein